MNGTEDVWVEVRDPQFRKLLFRYNPHRMQVEIVVRRRKIVVDLKQFSPLDKRTTL